MDELTEFEGRIDLLCARVSAGEVDERLLPDVEDALTEGYVHALKADAAARRVGQRLEAVLGDLEMASAAGEACSLSDQKRRIEESARRLRDKLGVLRLVAARAPGASAGST